MTREIFVIATLVACTGGLPVTVRAETPTFNCAKAQGEVEELICNDATLIGLDRQLDQAYHAALAKAEDKLAGRLREEQRGWVQGRNDCWKATEQTWITATWTVNTVKDCVDAQYRLRTAELQAVWQLVPSTTRVAICENNPVNEIVATFFATDPPTIRLERGDRTATLWRVGAASEGKYEGQNVSVVHAGDNLEVSWLDTNSGNTDELRCKAR